MWPKAIIASPLHYIKQFKKMVLNCHHHHHPRQKNIALNDPWKPSGCGDKAQGGGGEGAEGADRAEGGGMAEGADGTDVAAIYILPYG